MDPTLYNNDVLWSEEGVENIRKSLNYLNK